MFQRVECFLIRFMKTGSQFWQGQGIAVATGLIQSVEVLGKDRAGISPGADQGRAGNIMQGITNRLLNGRVRSDTREHAVNHVVLMIGLF